MTHDEDWDWISPPPPVNKQKKKPPNTPWRGKRHKQSTRHKMSKAKLGRVAISHLGTGEIKFVTPKEAAWLILSEGWIEGNCRAKGRPRKKPLT